MKRFFDTFDVLDRYTLEIDRYQDELQCQHCAKNDQFVSHGIVYKQRSQRHREAVGKRLLCSNRYGRSGCGRTFRLYVASQIPTLHYDATVLFVFLCSLLANLTVVDAYQKATGCDQARNAWRWLTKLDRKLGDYRCWLQTRIDTTITTFKHRTRRLQILLPTLQRLFSTFADCACASYQTRAQSIFM